MNESGAPKISVVVPVYNMDQYVGSAIESVLDGDFEQFEVIVVDDGSTDRTDEVLSSFVNPTSSRYDDRVRYVRQPNQGKAAAVNHGFSMVDGRYVAILDADDTLPSDSLAVRYRRCEQEGERVAAIGGFRVFDDETTYGVRHPPQWDSANLRQAFYLRWRTPFHLNACLFPSALIDRVGPMDERFRRCLDGDYAMRLLDAVDRVAIVRSVVYRYRKHRTSRAERLRTRLETARYRAQVSWKNYSGWRKWTAVPLGLTMDAGKFAYELFVGNYKQ